MTRKIKKYDILVLTSKPDKSRNVGRCVLGDFLVLSVKPEGIKIFSIRSKNILEYSLKEFSKKYEVAFYG